MDEKYTKIVIIDDEYLLRTGIRYLCDWHSEGFDIIGEAANGVEGLELIRKTHPDIVITDIRMPGMDGIDLTAQIKKEFPDIAVIILSSYDNFHYVKTTLKSGAEDYILKPDLDVQALIETLKKLKVHHTDLPKKTDAQYIFLNMIIRENVSHACALSAFNDAGLHFSENEPYYLLVGIFDPRKGTAAEDDAAEVRKGLTCLKDIHEHVTAVMHDSAVISLIQAACTPENLYQALKVSLESDKIKGILHDCIFGITEPFRNLSELCSAEKRARAIQEYHFYYPGQKLITPDMTRGENIAFPSAEISRHLDLLDIKSMKETMKEYILNCTNQHGTEPYFLKKNIEGQIYLAIQAIERAGLFADELNKRKMRMFRKIDDATVYTQLLDAIDYSCDMIEDTVKNELEKRNADILASVHRYVKEHCCEELRLSDVAKAVHLNYSYLSYLFHRISNERFTDYLQRIRVERAKELMRADKNLSLSEICAMSGFSDQSYFSKVFCKFEKMLPSQYQKIYHKCPKTE